jgi:hypothetical protein
MHTRKTDQHASDRLYEPEAREQIVKSQLALANGPDIVELHPHAAASYAARSFFL